MSAWSCPASPWSADKLCRDIGHDGAAEEEAAGRQHDAEESPEPAQRQDPVEGGEVPVQGPAVREVARTQRKAVRYRCRGPRSAKSSSPR
eukprot:3638739-Lingulodinium_polyedra.AAC.1